MFSSTVVHLIRNRPIDLPECTEIKHFFALPICCLKIAKLFSSHIVVFVDAIIFL